MKIVNYPVVSEVPSSSLPDPGVIRAPRGTNPVNASASGNRETKPMEPMATPRVQHPKLNRNSWVTSYAQARTQPRTANMKAKRNRARNRGKGK